VAASPARKVLAVLELIGAIAVTGVLVAGLLLPFTGGVGIAARNSAKAFEDQPCDVDVTNPSQASTIYAADGRTVIATFYAQNRQIVSFKQIPDVMGKAIVAIEDRRFYEHHGVDVEALLRAAVQNSRSGEVVQGGSTLTMQYVKNLRLYQAKTPAEQKQAKEQTTGRKLLEARCALALENKYSKDDILTRYLNISYFGAGAYGVQTAAKTYFGKNASKLTLPEAALLAGLVQSPYNYDPYRNKKAATARRNTVLDEMQSIGYITAAQAAKAKASPIRVVKKKPSNQGCANANKSLPNVGFFCDWVVESYLPSIGLSKAQLGSGGLKVYTTLSPTLQRRVQNGVSARMPANRKAATVMDVIDHTTGEVKAIAVSRIYGNKKNAKDLIHTTVPLGTRPTVGAGSTYKLFTLIAALERKIPLRDLRIKTGNEYRTTVCQASDEERKPVRNAGHYPAENNLEYATYASVNTFFVALLDQQFPGCDLSGPVQAAQKMGMNALNLPSGEGDLTEAQAIIRHQQYSFTLGPQRTSPLELAAAYGTVANDGRYCPPTPIKKIVYPNGKTKALPERTCEQVLDPGLAHTVTQVLVKDTKPGFAGTANRRFSGYYASGGSDVAGKTGTASAGESGKNGSAWFIGYTPKWVASVATFNPEAASKPLVDVPGYEGLSGEIFGAFSASVWLEGLRSTLLDLPGWGFPPEDPTVVNGNSIPVPSVVGQDVNTATQILRGAGFDVQVSGERRDSPLPPDRVADQSPSGRGVAGQVVYLYLSNGCAQKQPAQPEGGRRRPGRPTPIPTTQPPQVPGCNPGG